MALSESIPPAETVGARFTLLLAEERKRRKAFARFEEEELVRHKARKACIEQQAQQDPVVLETRQLLLAKEEEEYKSAKAQRKRVFAEKEKEHTMSVRDQLLAPLQSAPPVSAASTEREMRVPESGRGLQNSQKSSPAPPTSPDMTTSSRMTPPLAAIAVSPPPSNDQPVTTEGPSLCVTVKLPEFVRRSLQATVTRPAPPQPLAELPNVPARKRARSDDGPGGNKSAPMPRRRKTTPRTIKFNEVYCNGKPVYKHLIVEFPSKSACFYILRCDEHVVHFNKNPLHGAAKHLHSAQHGNMSKDHSLAVELLGHRIPDCTYQLADLNNEMVLAAFQNGYKPLNVNQMTKSDRRAYELEHGVSLEAAPASTAPSFPNLINWDAEKHTAAAKVETPTVGDLHLVFWEEDQMRYPVMVLPSQGPLELCGLPNRSLFDPPAHGPQPPSKTRGRAAMAAVPECYKWDTQTGRIVILGWAPGFEDGGSRVSEREIPVMFFDEGRNFGWVPLRELLPFNFKDPRYHEVPYFNDAVEHYAKIRGFGSSKRMMALADGLDPRTVRAPHRKPIHATNSQHARPRLPPQPQATPAVPSSGPAPARQERATGILSIDQQNKGLGCGVKKVVERRDGATPDSPRMAMTNQDKDVEMPDSATSETPFMNGSISATLASHPPLRPPLQSQATPTAPSSESAPTRQECDPGISSNDQQNETLGSDAKEMVERRDGTTPDSPSMRMTNQDKDVEMPNTATSETPSMSGSISVTLASQPPLPDRRASGKLDSHSMGMSEKDNDVSMGNTSEKPTTTKLVGVFPGGRHSDERTSLPPAPAQTRDPPQSVAKSDSRPVVLVASATGTPVQPTLAEPRSTSMGFHLEPKSPFSLPCDMGSELPARPVVSQPGGRIEPPPATLAPSTGPAVPAQSSMLDTNWWASYVGRVATEPQHITSKVPAMAPWAATDQANPPLQPRPSVEMAPVLSPVVPAMTPWIAMGQANLPLQPRPPVEMPTVLSPAATPAGSAAATPTLSWPCPDTSQPASPREARPGSVPSVDAKRADGQGECFDVSLYSDASRTVHRLRVDPEAKIASAIAGSLMIDPREIKEAIVEALETNRSSRMVKLVSTDEDRRQTLVFEAADVGLGQKAGSAHARRFCAWLMGVNRTMTYRNNSIQRAPGAK